MVGPRDRETEARFSRSSFPDGVRRGCVSRAKNLMVCYLGDFFFGRGKLAFRWRDMPLRNLVLGNREKERRRRHRKAGCLLYTKEVVG